MNINIEIGTSPLRDVLAALKECQRRDAATIVAVKRKRSLKPAERAMWLAELQRRVETFTMLHEKLWHATPDDVRKFL